MGLGKRKAHADQTVLRLDHYWTGWGLRMDASGTLPLGAEAELWPPERWKLENRNRACVGWVKAPTPPGTLLGELSKIDAGTYLALVVSMVMVPEGLLR